MPTANKYAYPRPQVFPTWRPSLSGFGYKDRLVSHGRSVLLTSTSSQLADSYTHALSLYESMAVVYPAGQEMSAKLDTLASKAEFFKGVKEQIEAARLAVEGAITEVANKHKDLAKKADDRASHRQDIKHYEEKLSGLAEKAKTNPKEKERLEENEKKLEDVSGM